MNEAKTAAEIRGRFGAVPNCMGSEGCWRVRLQALSTGICLSGADAVKTITAEEY